MLGVWCRVLVVSLLGVALARGDGPQDRAIQEAVRLALHAHPEFTALRKEVTTLRSEVEWLRGGRGGSQARNDHVTVQWLAGGVAELRSELAELSSAVNRSEELTARAELRQQARSAQEAVAALRKDVAQLTAQQQVRDNTLAEDLEDVRARCLGKHNIEMSNSVLQAGSGTIHAEGGRLRHQRVLKKRVETLTTAVRRIEERLRAPSHYQRVTTNDVLEEDLAPRVTALEEKGRQAALALFNVSRQVAGLGKLHASMLELLESVEGLENKVDSVVPDFRKEISRLEFTLAQLTSTVNIVREDQENQRTSVKAMGEAMSAMQEKLDQDHSRVKTLQTQMSNLTATGNTSRSGVVGIEERSLTEPQHAAHLPALVARLTHVMQEYDNIVADLPHECSWVTGPSGLYVVAPGRGQPLVTFCDQSTGAGGWTLVQRRTDGSQEFNRPWKEYAAGFGSPLGEFWIGNEALHRLTVGNDSSLRIDLVDIYGKAWHAEYDSFSVGNMTDGFRLIVSGYHGNASDALDYQNHMQFSAIDSDRDVSNTHCAANYEGGWWFSHCQHANLNGRYNLGLTWFDSSRNEWIAVARSEMKVRSRHRPASPAA